MESETSPTDKVKKCLYKWPDKTRGLSESFFFFLFLTSKYFSLLRVLRNKISWLLNDCSHVLNFYEPNSLNIFMISACPRRHALERFCITQCETQMWLSSLPVSNRSVNSQIILLLLSSFTLQ